MKRLLPPFFATLCLTMTPALHARDTAAAYSNQFACDILESLSKESGNIAFSPFSAWLALTMTSGGASGTTLAEMASTLHHPAKAGDAVHGLAGEWSRQLKAMKGIELSTANRLWIAPKFAITGGFDRLTQTYYQAGLERVDFAASTEDARLQINRWVSQQTAKRITDLLSPPDVTDDTRLILTNAIYFKANWQRPFNPQQTTPLPFTRANGEVMQAPMMLRDGPLPYLETAAFQTVRLAYAGEQTSMIVVLPKAGLPPVLTAESLATVTAGLREEQVTLRLPRFTTDQKLRMVPVLQSLGMEQAFTNTADFSRMSTQEALMIGNVVHHAFVKVGEKGTEAAAATAVVMRPRGIAPREEPKKQFIANRPFLFLIVHNSTGGILFLGRVDRPDSP